MSAHTPGPWAVGITSPERDPFVVTADDGTKYHRRVTVAETGPRPGVGEFKATANARLIAAAPDLLGELLKRATHDTDCTAVKVAGRFGSRSGLYWNESTDGQTCSCSLGAAIAKARGTSGQVAFCSICRNEHGHEVRHEHE